MPQSSRESKITRDKFLYTAAILFVYILGRSIPLYGIDISAYSYEIIDAEKLLMQMSSGDVYQSSIFSLGIAPYMFASLAVGIAVLCRDSDERAKISPRRIHRATLVATLVFAMLQALANVRKLKFAVEGRELLAAEAVAVLEMTAGAVLILWLSDRNKKYGFGGQSILICVNILDGILSTVSRHTVRELAVPFLIAAAGMEVIIIMENAEKRIPVQRVSIHNIYADKDYLAVKLNPVGVMPVMFSTVVFMLPQMLLSLFAYLLPDNAAILWWLENMTLSRLPGIAVYTGILYLLTVVFSFLFISPKDLTEQFLKSGDSLVGIHAGRDTRRYLRGVIFRISFFSAVVMGICISTPLLLQLKGGIDSTLVMFPSSAMMLAGICCNLYREFIMLRNYDSYRAFF